MRKVQPRPGQESAWDYPRPPRLERTGRRIRIEHRNETLADTTRAWRVLETSHPPVYYVPSKDVRMDLLTRNPSGTSFCEWKGAAVYYDVVAGSDLVSRVAFSYEDPTSAFEPIAGHVAFYAGRLDRCTVDGETVRPQPGSFYAGWITDDVVGPFKGEPGTQGW